MTSPSSQLANMLSAWPLDQEQSSFLHQAIAETTEAQAHELLGLLQDAEEAVMGYASFLAGETSAAEATSEEGLELPNYRFRPLNDRVLIRRLGAEEESAGGVIIPDTAKEKPMEGEVIATGPGTRNELGQIVELDVREGDRILFGKWSGTEVRLGGDDLLIMKESDVMGLLQANRFRPLNDRVLIRRLGVEEKSAGGVIIPDTAKEKPMEGEVIATGPGARNELGQIVELDVREGDRILFGKWSGTEVRLGGDDLLIMKESDVMGIVEGWGQTYRMRGAAA
jgi:chaperonin GroES